MKLEYEKSGQQRRKRSLLTRWNEFLDHLGKSFTNRFLGRLENVHEVRLWVLEWGLLVLAVFLLAVVQIMWYGDSYDTNAFTDGGEYSEATLGRINSMNPLYAVTNSEKVLAKLMFANLVSPDASGHEKAELAKSVTMDKTGKIWTLTLRDDLVWSDGEPITADDVIYTIDLINDTTAKTMVAVNFAGVKYKKTGDLTVEFTLPSVYTDFVDSLEFPLVPAHILKDISPALVYESDFSTKPVTSGPFLLNAMQVGGVTSLSEQTIYLNRNDNYFLHDAMLGSFTLKTYANTDDITEALRAGDIIATAELPEGQDINNNMSERTNLINGGVFAFLNNQSEVFKDVKVRQAIRYGIDMSKIREDIRDGEYLDYPILDTQAPELTYPELPARDTDKAYQLLADAKLLYNADDKKIYDIDGGIVSINVAVQKRDKILRVAEKVVNELNELGFEAVLNIFDESQSATDFFTSVIKPREYDILLYEVDLGVSADPFVYYSSTQATESGWNFSNYRNSLADVNLLSARITPDAKLRKAKYDAFLKTWVNDVPAIGIYRSTLVYYYVNNTQIYSDYFNSEIILTDALDRFADVRYWSVNKRSVNMTP